jgi:hypothetical protein
VTTGENLMLTPAAGRQPITPDEELASVEGEVLYYVARLSAWIERNRGAWTLDQLGQVSILLERLSVIKQRHQKLQIQRAALIERSVKNERVLERFNRQIALPHNLPGRCD